MQMMMGILTRLTFLEGGGPDKGKGRSSSDQRSKAGPPPQTDTTQSVNTDFTSVAKCVYRQVQLRHHMDNWTTLPGKLATRLRAFADDIKPPMPDDELRQAVSAATDEYGKRISAIVRDHLDRKLQATKAEAGRLNPMDVDRAQMTAEKYVSKRLGKKIENDRRQSMLQEAAAMIGKATTSQAPNADAEGFRQVQRNRNGSGKTGSINISDVVEQTSRTPLNKRMRVASADSPVSLSNRFSPLASTSKSDVTQSQPTVTRQPVVVVERLPEPPRVEGRPGLTIHQTDKKDEWELKVADRTRVLVIGDSNLRDTPQVPDHWEVHCFPGARMQHVTKMLDTLSPQASVSHIVCQVGINHRDDAPSRMKGEFRQMEARLLSTGKTVICTGIPVPMTATARHAGTINELNALFAGGPFKYICPVPSNRVTIKPMDTRHGIHHTQETVELVLQSMVNEVEIDMALN